MGILGIIFIYMINIILMLIVTLIIATLTLIERKILSLLQRRVGPYYVGYKGRLQYIADALKLFIKNTVIPHESSKMWFIFIPSFILIISYLFWINSIWGPNLTIFDIEYNIVYMLLLSILNNIGIILTGFFSKNKYSIIASLRCSILSINLELFLGIFIINLVFLSNSFNFNVFILLQQVYYIVFIYFYFFNLIILIFLLEVNRAPFDLTEAESELVAGYQNELGGFLFGLYYLGEYFHLFFFSATIAILIFGGWEINLFIYKLFQIIIYLEW